jgi:antitoxin PrlF
MIVSKLTSKSQTTIPQSVRKALGLKPGDELQYEIVDERVILTKARRGEVRDDPFRCFEEWSSEADERAYANL